jgi:hypothetical protein
MTCGTLLSVTSLSQLSSVLPPKLLFLSPSTLNDTAACSALARRCLLYSCSPLLPLCSSTPRPPPDYAMACRRPWLEAQGGATLPPTGVVLVVTHDSRRSVGPPGGACGQRWEGGGGRGSDTKTVPERIYQRCFSSCSIAHSTPEWICTEAAQRRSSASAGRKDRVVPLELQAR